jgi:peptidoglycan/xylan/chitin deacetylase (PgdA/CDA1 family)
MRTRRAFAIGLSAFGLLGFYVWWAGREGYYFRYLRPTDWYARLAGVYRMDGRNHILRQGPEGARVVALTFDDGPHPTTPELLDILRRSGDKATFFVVGANVLKRPEMSRRIVAEGHEIASHARDHYPLPTLRDDQVRRMVVDNNTVVERVTGVRMRSFRPPNGRYDARVLKEVKDAGMWTILWSNNTGDWRARDPEWLVRRVMSDLQEGDIILMHECHRNTLDAMPDMLAAIRARGFKTVTVSRLLEMHGAAGTAEPAAARG